MKTRLLLAAVLLSAVACAPTSSRELKSVTDYVEWQYRYMPLPDSLAYPASYWEANTGKAFDVRADMNWGIPEREFRHFVLPVRVNNEILDDFRTTYADTLCNRVRGMSLYDAALEINHWCHEQATYKPSDARTSAPMMTMRKGYGRCGEESVLTVAALRAAGIPARQVYTPRWAHTDDNHAWVEVWVDGKWYFLGACEPEPRLNMGWFNAPVSRAMILHTKVFGDYDGPEDVIRRTPCYTEINVTSGYVKAGKNIVRIIDIEGNPVSRATVQYKLYNYGEFFTVATYESDAHGIVSLNTGCGDMLVWAYKDGMYGFCVSMPQENGVGQITDLVLEHKTGETFSVDIDIVPPIENPIPTDATPEEMAANRLRLASEDSIRASHPHDNPDIEAFMSSGKDDQRAKKLLSCLTAKDLEDVTLQVLTDALEGASDDNPCILSPRVGYEQLRPFRREVLESGMAGRLRTVDDIRKWVSDSILLIHGRNPQNLRTPPICVWQSRKADRIGCETFFVALCRALGHAARIDEVTGKTQYFEDGFWHDIQPLDGSKGTSVDVAAGGSEGTSDDAATAGGKGTFSLNYDGGPVECPMYYRHFTISKIEEGSVVLQEYGSDADETAFNTLDGVADEGYYLLTTGTRLSDGSVLAHMEFFNVVRDSAVIVPLTLHEAGSQLSVIGSMDPECRIFLPGQAESTSIINVTGRGWFLMALMGDNDEPSSHARTELGSISEELKSWGRPLLILDAKDNPEAAAMYGNATLPVIIVADSFGRIVYKSTGYNTSLASGLLHVIGEL